MPKRFAKSQQELCVAIGKSIPTIHWYGAKGCPCLAKHRDSKGRYSITRVLTWMKKHGYGEVVNRGARPKRQRDLVAEGEARDDHSRLLKAQADEREEKAKIAEMDRLSREGELIAKADVDEEWQSIMRDLKAKILSWPKRVAPRLAGLGAPQIATALTKEVRALLEELSG